MSASVCGRLSASAFAHVPVCMCLHSSIYRTLNVRTHSDANVHVSLRLDASFVKDFWDILYPGSNRVGYIHVPPSISSPSGGRMQSDLVELCVCT